MRKIAAVGLLLAVAMTVSVGVAGAVGGTGHPGCPLAGATYQSWGPEGLVTIVGPSGAPFEVFTSTGMLVAAGALYAPSVSFVASNTGPGPGGVLLFVRVNDELLAVTDPDWDWN